MSPRWVHFELLLFKIFIFVISNVHLVLSDGRTFCYLPFDSPAIILNTTKGKDTNYKASEFANHAQLLNLNGLKANNYRWALVNNINASEEQKIKDFVLDQRWEKFIHNNDISAITEKLKGSNFSLYFSIKNYPEENIFDWTSAGWHHVLIKKVSNDDIVLEEYGKRGNITLNPRLNQTQLMNKVYKPKNIWKIHDYNYFHSNIPSSKQVIYNHQTSKCGNFQERCLYFYLAMCQNCTFNITIENTNTTSTIFNTTHARQWKQEKICSKMTECFNISVGTENHGSDNNFWAIGTEIYLSNCTNGSRYLSYNKKETWIQGCESPNSTIEILTSDHIPRCLNETKNQIETLTNTGFHLYYYITAAIVFCLIVITGTATGAYFIWTRSNLLLSASGNEEEMQMRFIDKVDHNPPNDNFIDYVQDTFKNASRSDILQAQFELLPNNYLKAHIVGKNPENMAKNSYKKIVAYDDTRVILRKLDRSYILSGDYINANYIEGLHHKHEYIASQNPLLSTLNDFWHMIWQENVHYIIMLSTFGQKDYVEYWPKKLGVPDIKDHKEFEVTLVGVKSYEFYKCRDLKIRFRDRVKLVTQYHFHSWFKPNLPCCPYILVALFKELRMFPREHPILIHCHAGIGRTGVILLCDMAIQLIESNRKVDMFGLTKNLRDCRYKMVENVNLYKLAHLVILEYLLYRDTCTSLGTEYFPESYKDWCRRSSNTFGTLQRYSWVDKEIIPFTFLSGSPEKIRYPDISLVEESQVGGNVINAHFVDGYRKANKFIVTQQPLKNTLIDFWTMVTQHRVLFIVNLQEINLRTGDYCHYFPSHNFERLRVCENIIVTCEHVEINQDFDKLTLEVNSNSIVHKMYCINLKRWLKNHEVPKFKSPLIEIWAKMNPMKDDEIAVICCDDGVKASGLFVTLCYLFDKAKEENDFDAISTVKAIRRSHPNFITNKQFHFILKAAKTFYKQMRPNDKHVT